MHCRERSKNGQRRRCIVLFGRHGAATSTATVSARHTPNVLSADNDIGCTMHHHGRPYMHCSSMSASAIIAVRDNVGFRGTGSTSQSFDSRTRISLLRSMICFTDTGEVKQICSRRDQPADNSRMCQPGQLRTSPWRLISCTYQCYAILS